MTMREGNSVGVGADLVIRDVGHWGIWGTEVEGC